MTVYQQVRDAVAKKLIVVATYDGFARELCPHAIGTTKAGVETVLCLQVGGGSKNGLKSDRTKNWRCCEVGKLSNVTVTFGRWQTASNYSLPHPCIDRIDLAVPGARVL